MTPLQQAIVAEYATCEDTKELAVRLGTTIKSLRVYAAKLGVTRRDTKPFIPQPGTAVEKALQVLRAAGRELSGPELADACGFARRHLSIRLGAGLKFGLIKYRYGDDSRGTTWWGPGDGTRTTGEKPVKPPKRPREVHPRSKAANRIKPESNYAVKSAPGNAQRRIVESIPRPIRQDAPVVGMDTAKRTYGPNYSHDPRFQCAPDEKPFGAGFSAVGIGRSVETGRAW